MGFVLLKWLELKTWNFVGHPAYSWVDISKADDGDWAVCWQKLFTGRYPDRGLGTGEAIMSRRCLTPFSPAACPQAVYPARWEFSFQSLQYLYYIFCKISARREKYQIYLNISEPQPNFKLHRRLMLVQGERNIKFIWIFPSRSLISSCIAD